MLSLWSQSQPSGVSLLKTRATIPAATEAEVLTLGFDFGKIHFPLFHLLITKMKECAIILFSNFLRHDIHFFKMQTNI